MVFGSFRRLIVLWSFVWTMFIEDKHTFRICVLAFDDKFALFLLLIIIINIIIIIS
jgi:hypothetical protein